MPNFFTEYFGIAEGTREVAVCCPFPHMSTLGVTYNETNPSASVNTEEGLFHCLACGRGYSITRFIQELFGCEYTDARKIQRSFENQEDLFMWKEAVSLTEASKERALSMGISEEVIKELHLGTPTGELDTLAFPVIMYDHIVDIRIYNPSIRPKVRSRANSASGLIIPYDIWRDTPANKLTLICAGEKDMAVARSHGFNAITITGGEQSLPILLKQFEGRAVAIVYDNDMTGLKGARKLAVNLLKYTDTVKVVTNFHEICKEPKEDITDFFMKYNQTRTDLIRMIEATPIFEPTEEDLKDNFPVMSLLEATKPQNINKLVKSNIQVVAVADTTFVTPAYITFEKTKLSGASDTMRLNEIKEWQLTDIKAQDVLHLIDNNFKEDIINKNLRFLAYVPFKENNVKMKTLDKRTVFKCYVTDMFETNDTSTQPMEFTAYAIGCKLESGRKYLVTYKLSPHPYKGQQLMMLITNAVQANDSVSNFKVTQSVKDKLDVIKDLNGTVEEKMHTITQKVKGLLNYDGNDTLIQGIDLSYHTVLQFDFGSFKSVRGYLDTIVVGESRVGKSSTADALRKTYELGTFTSLAGNSATVPGLIGGSNKTTSGFQTRAGIIPQNHRGLIIFEEFGKSNANITKELTDIRSSNEVRITRVAGTITLPAMVRMIALTNVKNTNGTIKPIASYPNGISIITELVDTAEDIARYDLIIILSDRGNNQVDPFWEPEVPFPTDVYQTRVRWIWSRTADQVIIDKEVGKYIIEKANELNKVYDCHIKIFGTEAWKKLARLSIAVAGYLISTDETYENIIVKKEHVDYAVAYMLKIYDNSTFKLKEYVEHEKRYSTIDDEGVELLQDLYTRNPSLVLQLEQCTTATKNMLGAGSGLSNDDLNKALNGLARGLFIKFANHDIVPTERFRLGLAKINRDTVVTRLGEFKC